MNAFEKWSKTFMETDEYRSDSFHWADMGKAAFKAGMLHAAEIAKDKHRCELDGGLTSNTFSSGCESVARTIRKEAE